MYNNLNHVALILDGNKRWAKKNKFSNIYGYTKGFDNKKFTINVESDKEVRKLFYLGSFPDPDILIRTGGYQRLSNFIMYNLTYTELFFTKTLWPEFSDKEFQSIIDQYLRINRKYGL